MMSPRATSNRNCVLGLPDKGVDQARSAKRSQTRTSLRRSAPAGSADQGETRRTSHRDEHSDRHHLAVAKLTTRTTPKMTESPSAEQAVNKPGQNSADNDVQIDVESTLNGLSRGSIRRHGPLRLAFRSLGGATVASLAAAVSKRPLPHLVLAFGIEFDARPMLTLLVMFSRVAPPVSHVDQVEAARLKASATTSNAGKVKSIVVGIEVDAGDRASRARHEALR